jgi:hypothetical protein
MINNLKTAYTYQDDGLLYLIHDDLVIVLKGKKLIQAIERDLKSDSLSENMLLLSNLLSSEGIFNLLGGEVTVNRGEKLLDEFQLEAYAKNPSSSGMCADGTTQTSGPTMADDSMCLMYAP